MTIIFTNQTFVYGYRWHHCTWPSITHNIIVIAITAIVCHLLCKVSENKQFQNLNQHNKKQSKNLTNSLNSFLLPTVYFLGEKKWKNRIKCTKPDCFGPAVMQNYITKNLASHTHTHQAIQFLKEATTQCSHIHANTHIDQRVPFMWCDYTELNSYCLSFYFNFSIAVRFCLRRLFLWQQACACVYVNVVRHRKTHVTCFRCHNTHLSVFMSRRYSSELTIMFDENCTGLLATNFVKSEREKRPYSNSGAFCCLFYFSLFILFYFILLYKYIFLYISNEIQICLATDLQIKFIIKLIYLIIYNDIWHVQALFFFRLFVLNFEQIKMLWIGLITCSWNASISIIPYAHWSLLWQNVFAVAF